MANTLYLRLEGPLQSWGERGRWSIRDTAPEPTKSGVIGLLGCAMGIQDDVRLRDLSESLHMGVRVDRPGYRMVDYHTIGGGYSKPMLLTAQGKPKKNPSGSPHTEVSERAYLCDASFLIALIGPDVLVEEVAKALQEPVWPYYLGRKSCPPTQPVFVKTTTIDHRIQPYDEALVIALKDEFWLGGTRYARSGPPPKRLRVIVECEDRPGAVRRRDVLLARKYRLFGPRYTRTTTILTPFPEIVP